MASYLSVSFYVFLFYVFLFYVFLFYVFLFMYFFFMYFFFMYFFLCISFLCFLSPLNKQKKHTHIAAFATAFSAREIARHCDTRPCDRRYSSDRTFWKTRYFDGTYAMVRMLSWSFTIRVMIRCPFLT